MSNNPQPPPLSTPSYRVDGRCFLITGGTQGLGLEIARQLKSLGATDLIVVSRSADKGWCAVDELTSDSCRAYFVQADIGNAEEASAIVSKSIEMIGQGCIISGVINAAGVTSRGNLFSTTADMFDEQMAVNVRGPFLVTQAAAKHMIERGCRNGSIVNIGSVAAHGGAPFIMAYSAAKAALIAMTKNNAAELAPKGIRVNAVNMGWCLTDNEDRLQTSQTDASWIDRADASVPLGRIMRPVDVATTVCFLLSSPMMTGSIIEMHPEYADGMISLQAEDKR